MSSTLTYHAMHTWAVVAGDRHALGFSADTQILERVVNHVGRLHGKDLGKSRITRLLPLRSCPSEGVNQ